MLKETKEIADKSQTERLLKEARTVIDSFQEAALRRDVDLVMSKINLGSVTMMCCLKQGAIAEFVIRSYGRLDMDKFFACWLLYDNK